MKVRLSATEQTGPGIYDWNYTCPARPGDSFTGPDGVELVVVPRAAAEAMVKAIRSTGHMADRDGGPALIWSALLSAMESSDDKG